MLAYFVAITLATLLYCSDVAAVTLTGFFALLILLVAAGYTIGGWRALLLALATIAGAFISDVFWQADWAPYDRSDEREPLPVTFSAILFVAPIALLLIAAGVGARKLRAASGAGGTRGRRARLSDR